MVVRKQDIATTRGLISRRFCIDHVVVHLSDIETQLRLDDENTSSYRTCQRRGEREWQSVRWRQSSG